jgi:hypothetical protein
MKDHGSGFLALILAGVLMMVIGIGLMMSAARAPENTSRLERPGLGSIPVFALRSTSDGSTWPAAHKR